MGKGEVATTLEAFRLQYVNLYSTLCQHAAKASQLRDHDSCQAAYLSRSKVASLVAEYRKNLPQLVMAPVLLELGDDICSSQQVGHTMLATALDCYKPVARLELFKASNSS